MELAPFEEERADYRAALIAAAIWNVQIAKNTKKGHTPTFREVKEFVLRFGDSPEILDPGPTRKQSSTEQWEMLTSAFLLGAEKKKE